MKRFPLVCAAFGLFGIGMTCASGQVAITEFINNADGEDDGAEWAELYNYSDSAVDLTGWVLHDEDSDSYALDGLTIEVGDFLILVGGSSSISGPEKKARFETEWLGGMVDDRVIGIDQAFAFGNSEDELFLGDNNGRTIWNLGYINDESNSFATFLTHDDYAANDYGNKAAPGIVREGDDNGVPGFLGYESQDSTLATDPNAYVSTNGDTGSPFFLSVGGGDVLTLVIEGTCPGAVDLVVTNATPDGVVAFLFAFGEGGVVIPDGNPCAGTALGLNATALLAGTVSANAEGSAVFSGNAPNVACGGFVQVLDVATCETSNVEQL